MTRAATASVLWAQQRRRLRACTVALAEPSWRLARRLVATQTRHRSWPHWRSQPRHPRRTGGKCAALMAGRITTTSAPTRQRGSGRPSWIRRRQRRRPNGGGSGASSRPTRIPLRTWPRRRRSRHVHRTHTRSSPRSNRRPPRRPRLLPRRTGGKCAALMAGHTTTTSAPTRRRGNGLLNWIRRGRPHRWRGSGGGAGGFLVTRQQSHSSL